MREWSICSEYPEILYKYFPYERADFFQKHCLRFTPIKELNDPFESSLQIFGKLKYTETTEENYNRYTTWIENMITRLGVGVLSLSSNPLNLLLHTHYASNHKGFVVGFKVGSLLHTFYHHNNLNFYFDKVRYTDERPKIHSNDAIRGKIDINVFFHKSDSWSYEHEWRMLIKNVYHVDELGIRGLVKIQPEAVREIYLCTNVYPDLIWKSYDFFKTNPFSNLYNCFLNEENYSLVTRQINRR